MTAGERTFSRGEILADGIVHAVGLSAAVVAASALVTATVLWGGSIPAAAIYAFGLVAMLGCSAAYNLGIHLRFREALRRLDLAAIYLMIAGTYTPFTVGVLKGGWAIGLTIAVWAIAAVGIALKVALAPHSSQRLTTFIYVAFGWVGVVAAGPFLAALTPAVLVLLVAGGVVYTLGTIVFALENLPYNRAIWHVFVLAGAAIHFCAIFAVLGATA